MAHAVPCTPKCTVVDVNEDIKIKIKKIEDSVVASEAATTMPQPVFEGTALGSCSGEAPQQMTLAGDLPVLAHEESLVLRAPVVAQEASPSPRSPTGRQEGVGSPREPVAPWSNPETDNEKVTCICALKPMDGAPLAGKSAHGRRRQLPFTGSSDSSGHRNVRVREAPRTGSSSILSEHKAASSSDSPQEESAPPSSCSARQALSSIGSPEQESASPNSCSGASVDE